MTGGILRLATCLSLLLCGLAVAPARAEVKSFTIDPTGRFQLNQQVL